MLFLSNYFPMMNKRKLLIVIGLFLIILTGARILWNAVFINTDLPHVAVNGELDLRDWDAAAGRTVTLDGQWEFYPQQFLMQSEIGQTSTENVNFIQVPGSWNASLFPDRNTPYGYGSYRLRILVKPQDRMSYSIRIPSVRSSSELYVNGRLLAQSGQPAAIEEQYTARNVPYTATFIADGIRVIEVVVHAANFKDSSKSGIVRSIKFGTEDAIYRETQLSITMQQTVALAFLIHAAYAIILFFMGNRDKKLIYFSLLVINVALIMLMGSDEKLLSYWFPINYDLSLRLMFFFVIAVAYSLLQCIMYLLPSYWRTAIFPGYAVLCGAAALSALLLPTRYLLLIHNLFLFIITVFTLMAVVSMLRTTLKGIKDNQLLLLSLMAFVNDYAWRSYFLVTGIKIVYYPFDLIVAMIAFSSIWFKRYFQVFSETKELAAKLQKVDKLKDEFLANTSHELRNPLHGILNISQAVLEREQKSLNDATLKDLELLLTIGRRMAFMLNDLLDMVRLKESRIQLQKQNFSVHTIASGVQDMLRFLIEGKPIQINNYIPVDFPYVNADENRLIQILFNLLHNAVKYTDEGEISIRAQIENDMARILIEDTGLGIDVSMQQKVFEPYEQLDPNMKRAGGGFGLGLSICKQLVELHGGTLKVDSTLGGGSVFSFTLYLADINIIGQDSRLETYDSIAYEETAAVYSLDDQSNAITSENCTYTDKIKILAVDDEPINLKVLVNIFSLHSDYEVLTVTSGQEALSLLNSKEWDLVIADVMMPYMSGYELTRKIREQFMLFELPVILLTARSRVEDINIGFLSGANDYVIKPVNGIELRSRVKSLVELKKAVRSHLSMEAAWLQAQIKPHFILNTFNAVAALSWIDTGRMNTLIEEFSNYIRVSIDFLNTKQLVPLEYELDLVRSYLYIEKERFGDRLKVIWEVDNIKLEIPPLSIQPLVENAVIHGILKRTKGGKVHIQIIDYETYVEVCIKDDGVGMDEDTSRKIFDNQTNKGSGIGLRNTDRRLKGLYGSGLQVESILGNGTTVSFVVAKKSVLSGTV
jgi:two-component system sensor histidine kinase ChiS